MREISVFYLEESIYDAIYLVRWITFPLSGRLTQSTNRRAGEHLFLMVVLWWGDVAMRCFIVYSLLSPPHYGYYFPIFTTSYYYF